MHQSDESALNPGATIAIFTGPEGTGCPVVRAALARVAGHPRVDYYRCGRPDFPLVRPMMDSKPLSLSVPEPDLEALLRRRQGLRFVWRAVLRLRYRLLQRHRHGRHVVERVEGRPFVVLPEVFNPKLFRTGAIMARELLRRPLPSSSTVLDLGTGSGVGAVFAALSARRVDAVDLNPHAARCARINVLLHGLEERIAVHDGDLFGPVAGRTFDVVLFNPPFFAGSPEQGFDLSWRTEDVHERFAEGLAGALAEGGFCLLLLSSDGRCDLYLETLRRKGFSMRVRAREDLLNEIVTIYQVERASQDAGESGP